MKRLCDVLTPNEVGGQPLTESLLVHSFQVDSRLVCSQDLFLLIPSLSSNNSESYVQEAIHRGASVILIQQGTNLLSQTLDLVKRKNVLILEVENARWMASYIANKFFPNQPQVIAGITGTNGKTSVASFTRQFWEIQGNKSASLGTLWVQGTEIDPSSLKDFSNATPDPLILYPILSNLKRQGIDHVSMEVSSHGLDLFRADHVKFNVGAFTNLSHEHLDYHKTMDAYFKAKARLFTEVLPSEATAVVNTQTSYGQEMVRLCKQRGLKLITVGHENSDIRIQTVKSALHGSYLTFMALGKRYTTYLPLVGQFQVENVLTALAIVISTGMKCDEAVDAFEKLQGVKGRMELVGQTMTGASVFVDYAHKPLALETVLKALRAHTKGCISVVFGCGGDRDQAKREMMGKIATEHADSVIITDDNPRTEDPQAIRKQVLKGAPLAREIASREEAIKEALFEAREGDICLIAGKGHEQGQIIGSITYPFCDRTVAQAILVGMEGRVV